MTPTIKRFCLCIAILFTGGASAEPLNYYDAQLLQTRTTAPQPSPQLVRALELDVPPWHRKGVPPKEVKIDDEAIRRSTEAALTALQALDPKAAQNDFDRAWLAFETASALLALRRENEARAAYERLLTMPRTNILDRRTLMALYELGDERRPGGCWRGSLKLTSPSPRYPVLASSHRIEGWVNTWLDVQPDGTIKHVEIESSSMRVFEAPVIEWLLQQRLERIGQPPPARPCFVRAPMTFQLTGGKARITAADIEEEAEFSYRSIGAAIRIRAAAREAALARQAASPPAAGQQ